jgi:hypothetical protein
LQTSVICPVIVAAATAAIVAAGVALGSHAASSSDAYGYVSQAQLWRRGTLVQAEPLARTATWANAAATLAPLGYRPAHKAYAIVPTYAPGLPILMALAAMLAGPCGVYLVVPATAGLLVWLTYAFGRRASDRLVAMGAAVLVATSPTVLFMMMWPMSDVPVAAFWLAALVTATAGRPLPTAMLAGVAILIRPNLAPLVVVPIALLVAGRAIDRRAAWRAAVWAALGVAPFAIAIALLNHSLYGSAFESGYGAVSGLYAAGNVTTNLALHARWLYESQGPYVFAAFAGAALAFRPGASGGLRWAAAFAALVWCAYLPYHVYRDWWYLRFLLPALPLVHVLAVDAVSRVTTGLGERWRAVAVGVFVAAAATHGVRFALQKGIAGIGDREQRFVEAGRYVRSALAENAVVFATEHSGSIRYYARRETLRYDRLDREWLDRTIERLAAMNYHAYAVLDEGEERAFRIQFAGQTALQHLAAGPIAELDSGIKVRIFDLSPGDASTPRTPERIPHLSRAQCAEPE